MTFHRCIASLFVNLFVFCCLILPAQAQQPTSDRWEKTIQAFEKKDEQSPPEKGGILFLGSSTVTRWDTDKGFPDLNVINRGFGGTQISDQLQYMDRIVWKYEPKIIVFYCGDNDINARKTPERVLQDFTTFHSRLKERLPDTKLVYLPIKPSLKRWQMWDQMQVVNRSIKQLSEQDPNLYYCDVATIGLNEQGEPRPEFFVKDGLHLSEEGYAAWNKAVREQLDAIR